MDFLDNYRINKAIAMLLAAPDGTSPEAIQAVSTLKRMGQAAIPKLIEALGKAHHPRVVAYLFDLLQDAPADIREGALELLQMVGNADAIKEVVATSKDPLRVGSGDSDPHTAERSPYIPFPARHPPGGIARRATECQTGDA